MRLNTARRFAGVLMILFGLSVLLGFQTPRAMNPLNWWPMLLILSGLSFERGALDSNQRNPGLAVPAGVLLVWGGVLLIGSLIGWHWPVSYTHLKDAAHFRI